MAGLKCRARLDARAPRVASARRPRLRAGRPRRFSRRCARHRARHLSQRTQGGAPRAAGPLAPPPQSVGIGLTFRRVRSSTETSASIWAKRASLAKTGDAPNWSEWSRRLPRSNTTSACASTSANSSQARVVDAPRALTCHDWDARCRLQFLKSSTSPAAASWPDRPESSGAGRFAAAFLCGAHRRHQASATRDTATRHRIGVPVPPVRRWADSPQPDRADRATPRPARGVHRRRASPRLPRSMQPSPAVAPVALAASPGRRRGRHPHARSGR